jgi:transposase-like protein
VRPGGRIKAGLRPFDVFARPIQVNVTMPLLRSWLRPHRGVSQEKLPVYLGFFQFVHNARRRGKALLGALVIALVT